MEAGAGAQGAISAVVVRGSLLEQVFGYLYIAAEMACIPLGVLALRDPHGGGVAALVVVYLLGFSALGAGLDAVTNRLIADGKAITYRSWLRNKAFVRDDVIDVRAERRSRRDGRTVVRLRTKSKAKPIRLLCVRSYRSERKHAYVEAINAPRPTSDP